jgi:hypothetical protein
MWDGDVPVLQETEAQSKPVFPTCDALMLFFQAFGLISILFAFQEAIAPHRYLQVSRLPLQIVGTVLLLCPGDEMHVRGHFQHLNVSESHSYLWIFCFVVFCLFFGLGLEWMLD